MGSTKTVSGLKRTKRAAPSGPPSEPTLDEIWAQFKHCQPQLTDTELDEASEMLFGRGGVRTVRAGLCVLTRSGGQLLEVMHSDPSIAAVYRELAECLENRSAILRGLAQDLDTARTRLQLALCEAPDDVGGQKREVAHG